MIKKRYEKNWIKNPIISVTTVTFFIQIFIHLKMSENNENEEVNEIENNEEYKEEIIDDNNTEENEVLENNEENEDNEDEMINNDVVEDVNEEFNDDDLDKILNDALIEEQNNFKKIVSENETPEERDKRLKKEAEERINTKFYHIDQQLSVNPKTVCFL